MYVNNVKEQKEWTVVKILKKFYFEICISGQYQRYAIGRFGGRVVAFHNGRRADQSYAKLWGKMAGLPVRRIYTDEWGPTPD